MTDGPYRDLGSGFVRLGGSEVPRRLRSPMKSAEDVLAALLDNAALADAANIYVASSLRSRRFRTLTVIDDGTGIPDSPAPLVFDPGVTARASGSSAGMSLHHIKAAAVEAKLVRNSQPTAFKVVLDTGTTPEKAIQSKASPTRADSNLPTTALHLATHPGIRHIYYASPSRILATLYDNHIIRQMRSVDGRIGELGPSELVGWGRDVGIEVSVKTAKRILACVIPAASPLEDSRPSRPERVGVGNLAGDERRSGSSLRLDERETREIEAILRDAARRVYLSVGRVEVRSSGGEISLKARIFEQEDEYQ